MDFLTGFIMVVYFLISYISFYIVKAIMNLIKTEKGKLLLGSFFESLDCCFLLTLIDLFIYDMIILQSISYNVCNITTTIICTIITYYLSKLLKIKSIFFNKLNLKIVLIYLVQILIQESGKFISMYLLHF